MRPKVFSLAIGRGLSVFSGERLVICSDSPNSLLFFQGGSVDIRNGDTEALFRQSSAFLYVSGVPVPDCLLTIELPSARTTLFVPDVSVFDAVWVGRVVPLAELQQRYEVDEVRYISAFNASLEAWAPAVLFTQASYTWPLPPGAYSLNTTRLDRQLGLSRMVKSSKEVALMALVSQVSSEAFLWVMREIDTGLYEYEMEAAFLYLAYACGLRQWAYVPICASGYNSAILHYNANDMQLNKSSFFLMDAGAEYVGYGTDITRTFPSDKHWTTEQKLIYSIVLDAQLAAIALLQPGVIWVNVTTAASRVLLTGLEAAGLLQDGSVDLYYAYGLHRVFMPHGLGGHTADRRTHDWPRCARRRPADQQHCAAGRQCPHRRARRLLQPSQHRTGSQQQQHLAILECPTPANLLGHGVWRVRLQYFHLKGPY
jgi:Xaa-Pro aminopeptidase